MIAQVVARPVLARLDGRRVAVAGAGRDAAYLDLDGFVVVVGARGAPLLPNGVALAERPAAWPATIAIAVDGAEVWDSTVTLPADPARVGADILQTLDQPYERGQTPLMRAVENRDRELAATAAAALVGRGPGLTPEGDDVIAATVAVVAAGRWPEAEKAAWLCAALGPDLRARTTSLSATLLELAAAGQVAEPLQALLAGHGGALARLLRLGHSTGHAYARAAARALTAIG